MNGKVIYSNCFVFLKRLEILNDQPRRKASQFYCVDKSRPGMWEL